MDRGSIASTGVGEKQAFRVGSDISMPVAVDGRKYYVRIPPVALRPNADHGRHILEVSRSHTTTYHDW